MKKIVNAAQTNTRCAQHGGLFETGRQTDRHEKYRCHIRTPQDGGKERRNGQWVVEFLVRFSCSFRRNLA